MRDWIVFVLLLFLLSSVNAQDISQLEAITRDSAENLREFGTIGRGTVNALDWHPDGERLAVGSSTGVWLLDEDLSTLEATPIHQFISGVTWSPDGRHIAVTSNAVTQCTVQVWANDFSEKQFELDSCGDEAVWSQNNTHVVVMSRTPSGNTVLLIDTNTNQISNLPGWVGVWSPSGAVLFTEQRRSPYSSGTPMRYIWDVNSGEQVSAVEIPRDQYLELLWGIDDHTAATLCFEYEEETDRNTVGLCRLDIYTAEVTWLYKMGGFHSGQGIRVFRLSWNDDETLLAHVSDFMTLGFLSAISVINANTDEMQFVGDGDIYDWKPGTNALTAAVGNGEIQTYNAQTGAVIASSKFFTAPVNRIAIRPGSEQVASAGFGYGQDTMVWDTRHSWLEPLLAVSVEPAELVDYTPGGSELIAGGTVLTDIYTDLNVVALNAETGERTRLIRGFSGQTSVPRHFWNADYTEYVEIEGSGVTLGNGKRIETHAVIQDVIWSPDDTKVATVESYPFFIRTWDTVSGEQIDIFGGDMTVYHGLAWSPDGTKIAVMVEHQTDTPNFARGVVAFDVIQGQNAIYGDKDFMVGVWVNILESDQQASAAWNSDGTMLAIALANQLQVYDIQDDSTPLVTLPAYRIVDLEWSSDDRFIAGGSADGTIHLWGLPGDQ